MHDDEKSYFTTHNYCKDYVRGTCSRGDNCRFVHEMPPKSYLKEMFRFCHDFQNKGCFRANCKFMHSTVEDEDKFYSTGAFPREVRKVERDNVCQAYLRGACNSQDCGFHHPSDVFNNDFVQYTQVAPTPPSYSRHPTYRRDDDCPPDAKFRRYAFEENGIDKQIFAATNNCTSCESLEHKVTLLHDNISVLLKKVADLTEKNVQLSTMNEFLLAQTSSIRTDQSCVITSRHGTSAPVSLATVSVTPIVSLAGALPGLVPASATPNLALAPAASRAQLLTPAPQLLTVSTTQQLVGNSGALIMTSAGAQQLMQVSDSGTLMGGGQTVVAMPAQLTLAPTTQQLMSNASQTTVQQLVQTQLAAQQSAQQQLAAQQSAQHLAAQQSVQHLAAQQSAQHLAAQQSAQHMAARQSAQHLAVQQSAQHAQHLVQRSAQHLVAQQSAQHLAAQQSALAARQSAQQLVAQQTQHAQQQMVPSAQQLVHQTSTQQITISSTSQPMALPNSQAQGITFPIISQSILPH